MKELKTTSTRIVYENKWMRVREDSIMRPNGTEGIYGVVEKPDFAVIIPFDGKHFYLLDQYRYPIKQRSLEFPQGTWEDNPNVDPDVLARGELREETGLEAGELDYLGFQYLATGYSNQKYHIFLATDLTYSNTNLDYEEEGLITVHIEKDTFSTMIKEGKVLDATTTNAYLIAKSQSKV